MLRAALMLALVIFDVILHQKLHPAKPAAFGLFFSTLIRPVVARDAIDGDDCACAILAVLAVNEDRPVFWLINNRQHLFDPFIRRSLHTGHRNTDVAQPGETRLLFSGARPLIKPAQIDNCFDAERGEPLDAPR
jgi:hypothetical protein